MHRKTISKPEDDKAMMIKDICNRLSEAIEEIEEICSEEDEPMREISKERMFEGIGLYYYVKDEQKLL